MPSLFVILQLHPPDWQRYRDIRLRALADTPDAFGRQFDSENLFDEEEWVLRLQRSDAIHFAATEPSGNDVGLVAGAPYDDDAGLYSMWVSPEARGQGVGSALIDEVIQWAKVNNRKRLLLDVGDNNTPAIKLYESKGFHPTGITGTLPPPREHIKEHQRQLLL